MIQANEMNNPSSLTRERSLQHQSRKITEPTSYKITNPETTSRREASSSSSYVSDQPKLHDKARSGSQPDTQSRSTNLLSFAQYE